MQDNTNTYRGFEKAQDMLSQHGRNATKGQLVMLITDGAQNMGLPAKKPADQLKQAGVQIFGVGVGLQIDKPELQSWVSTPVTDHYFSVKDFADLDKILRKIVSSACPPP